MKKRKLKPVVKISLFVIVFVTILSIVLLNNNTKKVVKQDDNYTYVNDYIFDSYYPVINQEEKIIRPFNSDKVTIFKTFYEKDDDAEKQKNSIIYHEGIYMPNSGIDYTCAEKFDVISSLSGTVTNITTDSLLGNTVEIRGSNDLVFMYQSLGEVLVKKNDVVKQGQVIGKSGISSLHSDNKEGLHFEIYKNGQVINPEKVFDKSLNEIDNN